MKREKKPPLRKTFGYAFEGILTGIRKERNMRIHTAAMILVVFFGTVWGFLPRSGVSAWSFSDW